MADKSSKSPLASYKRLSSSIISFILSKQKPKASMPDNHIFYSQLIEHLTNLIKNTLFFLLEIIIFLIVLVDGLLGLATIIYIINSNYVFAFLCWLGISFLCFQFIQVLEQRKLESKFTLVDIIKILFSILLGAITGIIVWPAFDKDFGYLVGIAFGALFGITLKLVIDIISLELRQKKP
ncbi:MAG: hypothetical protein HY819_11595 [Acidobacteria bacterium]|nr:hypothetical protein [Acidobacteriota bacterium]